MLKSVIVCVISLIGIVALFVAFMKTIEANAALGILFYALSLLATIVFLLCLLDIVLRFRHR